MDQKLDETPKARAETRAFLLINRLLGRLSALAPPADRAENVAYSFYSI
jgi:hypothetical protein